jgi:hypothetical protein
MKKEISAEELSQWREVWRDYSVKNREVSDSMSKFPFRQELHNIIASNSRAMSFEIEFILEKLKTKKLKDKKQKSK